MMITDMLIVLGGLAGLFVGGEWLVRASSRLAASFGMSPLVIGLTVVAFGTSTPELAVSLNAALGGVSDIAIGNVIGSNIANIGLILGVGGLIAVIPVHVILIRREIPLMIGMSVVVFLMALDGEIGRLEGGALFVGLLSFNAYLLLEGRREHPPLADERKMAEIEGIVGRINRGREMGRLVAGLALLLAGAHFTVEGAVAIARGVGISELVIGITLVAVGTSLPELVTSVVAALRSEPEIAVGNIIGSNMFNLACILALTAIVRPVPVSAGLIQIELPVMLGFSALLLPFVLDQQLQRWQALIFLLLYAGFIIYMVSAQPSLR